MSNYTKSTNFATKDNLPAGNALKRVKGAEIDDEFNALSVAIATKANTNNATLTGTPVAPTAITSTNSPQIATTAYVQSQKVSPAFTGTPIAPTASVGTNTTQVATTAFVQAASATSADILTSIKTVDGTGSGLDADLLDGNEASAFLTPTGDGSQLTGISSFALPTQVSLTTTSMTGNTNGTYVSVNLGSGGAGWYYFQDFSEGCLLQNVLGWHNNTSDDDGVYQHAWSDTAGIFYCTATPRLYSLRWGNNNNIYTGGSIKWVKFP